MAHEYSKHNNVNNFGLRDLLLVTEQLSSNKHVNTAAQVTVSSLTNSDLIRGINVDINWAIEYSSRENVRQHIASGLSWTRIIYHGSGGLVIDG